MKNILVLVLTFSISNVFAEIWEDYEPIAAPMILEKYGNVASAGSLIAFHETKSDFEPGDIGVICSFGAGYSICSLVIERV